MNTIAFTQNVDTHTSLDAKLDNKIIQRLTVWLLVLIIHKEHELAAVGYVGVGYVAAVKFFAV